MFMAFRPGKAAFLALLHCVIFESVSSNLLDEAASTNQVLSNESLSLAAVCRGALEAEAERCAAVPAARALLGVQAAAWHHPPDRPQQA